MPISQKQIDAIVRLSAPKRYEHFIKKVVGWRKVWGLYADGWAMSETVAGEPVFPLWPESEYAQLCATEDWAGYEPRDIGLEEFLDDLLLTLVERGVRPGVFFVPEGDSVDVPIDQLRADLERELARYE